MPTEQQDGQKTNRVQKQKTRQTCQTVAIIKEEPLLIPHLRFTSLGRNSMSNSFAIPKLKETTGRRRLECDAERKRSFINGGQGQSKALGSAKNAEGEGKEGWK